mmetsp:Transcript_5845/g.18381  ORF Transcript_5845/g.18381 Transcript_5845/m.18381 type:complete len:250 (-) Transcript_5845:7-756(-)
MRLTRGSAQSTASTGIIFCAARSTLRGCGRRQARLSACTTCATFAKPTRRRCTALCGPSPTLMLRPLPARSPPTRQTTRAGTTRGCSCARSRSRAAPFCGTRCAAWSACSSSSAAASSRPRLCRGCSTSRHSRASRSTRWRQSFRSCCRKLGTSRALRGIAPPRRRRPLPARRSRRSATHRSTSPTCRPSSRRSRVRRRPSSGGRRWATCRAVATGTATRRCRGAARASTFRCCAARATRLSCCARSPS